MFYKVLDGVKIVEYGNLISAPFCAKILADLGAEVIKIEVPGLGDESRRREPYFKQAGDYPKPGNANRQKDFMRSIGASRYLH
jgi:crotonobetainyl-CoA:carnitine CoA-transferase CaiB-like acyl-CoA transferase